MGAALSARTASTINRLQQPLLSPQDEWKPREVWELKGDVPHAIFSAANPVVEGTVYVYYGGAERVIGRATAGLEELLEWVLRTGREA